MKFFDELRQGASNVIADIKRNMAAKAADNKIIKDIESKAAFEERKKQAEKTAKFRVQTKGKKDRELIKNPVKYNAPQNFDMFGSQPQTKQTDSKKPKQVQEQELFNPNTAMDMVNFNPFKKEHSQ